jgi:aldose 1-epimerase
VLTLESGAARLVVAPERGGRIMALSVDGLDLLVTPDVDDHNFGCFPMAPWAGRIRHGSFDFDGQRYQLPLNNPPHAIHGTARDHPWQEDGEGVISASLDHPWPFGGRVVQRFGLAPDALHLTMEVHAAGESMPVSCGWHPWWSRNTARGEPLQVDLEVGAMYQKDEDGIPDGSLVAITAPGGTPVPDPFVSYDDCFTQLGDRPAVLRWPGAISVTLETSCPCVVVFDEPEHAICVEPQSHPPDAFNLGPTVVRPGEPLVATASWSWKLENG